MNIDLASATEYGDAQGLRQFMLDHRFVHAQTAFAVVTQFNVSLPSIGLSSSAAEDAWIALMEAGQRGEHQVTPLALTDWLNLHSQLHQYEYEVIAPSISAPDLSTVDFSKADQFYDWMQAHQQIHDSISQALGITS